MESMNGIQPMYDLADRNNNEFVEDIGFGLSLYSCYLVEIGVTMATCRMMN